jgi:hypothetical protein
MQEQALDKFRDLFIICELSRKSGRRHGLLKGLRHACRGKQFLFREPLQKFKVLAHL